MKCPITIPVEKEISTKDALGKTYYRIIDANKHSIAAGLTEKKADYIVNAINSHEKLVEEIEPVLADMNTIKNILQESSPHNDSASIVRPVDCKCGFCLMETMICRSHIKLEQALKEAEKQ